MMREFKNTISTVAIAYQGKVRDDLSVESTDRLSLKQIVQAEKHGDKVDLWMDNPFRATACQTAFISNDNIPLPSQRHKNMTMNLRKDLGTQDLGDPTKTADLSISTM